MQDRKSQIQRDKGYNPVRVLCILALEIAHTNSGLSKETARNLKAAAHAAEGCIVRHIEEKQGGK